MARYRADADGQACYNRGGDQSHLRTQHLTGTDSHHDDPSGLDDQRREHVRRLLQIPASVRQALATLTWKVNFINIGRGGAAFVTERVLDVGDDVELSFHLP